MARRRLTFVVTALVTALLVVAVAWLLARRADSARGATNQARFVGSASCARCHAAEYTAWRASQHAASMQAADSTTILGRVDDVTLTHRDGRYLLTAGTVDGSPRQYPLRYTFGVAPIQQYLTDAGGGRLYAIGTAWDSRPKAAGGQRWFRLDSGELRAHAGDSPPSDRQQSWNFMCADCHSTGVRKGYDARTDRYATRWADVDVSCEACHGPGSAHVDWIASPLAGTLFWRDSRVLANRRGDVRSTWVMDSARGIARRATARTSDREVQLCAQCHARRAQIADGHRAGEPLLDAYVPALLTRDLYHADGQQREEVYTYGSFLESRMYHRGVTCSDCHDPHTQRLRAPGNATCTQCHLPAKYDAASHHHHTAGTPQASCASCHMPATTYMQIDPRRDHSIRIPRPDLTMTVGTPNACASCHAARDARWADSAVRAWYGPERKGFQRFAREFAADDSDAADAATGLRRIAADTSQSAIARASALARLAARADATDAELAASAMRDRDPLIRLAALQLLEGLPPAARLGATALLGDSLRAIRMQAAWLLAPAVERLTRDDDRAAFARARDEFIASQRFNADRAEHRTTLGTFFMTLGRADDAAAEYRAAITLAPQFAPAYVNLADLERSRGREPEAERVLRDGLARAPGDARLHHALALSLARAGRSADAVSELAKATSLAPTDATYAYAYAVALNSTGNRASAIRTLEVARRRHPTDPQLLYGLALFQRDAGNLVAARALARELLRLRPSDDAARALAASLDTPPPSPTPTATPASDRRATPAAPEDSWPPTTP